jgi:hypothetical protein
MPTGSATPAKVAGVRAETNKTEPARARNGWMDLRFFITMEFSWLRLMLELKFSCMLKTLLNHLFFSTGFL